MAKSIGNKPVVRLLARHLEFYEMADTVRTPGLSQAQLYHRLDHAKDADANSLMALEDEP